MKNSFWKGLRGQFFAVGLISVALLAVSVIITCVFVVRTAMYGQVRAELEGCVEYIQKYYDGMEGDFKLVVNEDKSGAIYKGDKDITNDYSVLDSFSESFDADVSIFCTDVRALTTFRDGDGNRMINTGTSAIVSGDVYEGGHDAFYSNVLIGEDKYFAYYRPILNSDGSVFGMYGVCRNAANVNRGVNRTILPIILLFAVAAVLIALATGAEAGRTVKMLNVLNRFMEKVAKSDFEVDLPEKMISSDDEIGVLARTGKQMQNSIRKLVNYDALTEVHNRRYAVNELREVCRSAEEEGTEFCVAIGDIDFFKKVNDTYGHDAGDIVLKEVAAVFRRRMGGQGFIARWGGEEFLFVFTNCSLEQALSVLTAVIDDIRSLEIEYEGQIISPRVSMGLVQGERGDNEEQCVKKADDLLYYAKEHGRNRLVTNDIIESEVNASDEPGSADS